MLFENTTYLNTNIGEDFCQKVSKGKKALLWETERGVPPAA